MKYMREVILHLYKRNLSNNENEYKAVLHVIYAGRIPVTLKNCPSFSEEEKFEDILKFHLLTKEGINVKKKINY